MALIHVFNGIEDKTTYTFNGKICDNIKNIDWKNSIILRGGYRVDENYEVQPYDILYIRKTPAADPVSWAIGLGVMAIVAGGVALGVSIYNNKKALSNAQAAQQAAKTENKDALPYIKGARNAAATGRSFPYAIGKSLMTPYRLCPPHYTIAGNNGTEQYFNIVLEVAYNNILINKIKLGETTIKDFAGITEPQNGQYEFDAGTYYDDRNLIEIRQTGAFEDPEFNKKIILTELSTEVPHDHATDDREENEKIEQTWKTGVVQQLASHAQAVELIVLFDGLQKYKKDHWQNHTIELRPQWTNVDNPEENDWVDFDAGFNQNGVISNTFTYNTRKQMRFAARQEFTAQQAYNKNIKVRVIRTTPKTEDTAKDSVYLLAVQTTCYDAKKSSSDQLVTAEVMESTERDKCCRIGVRFAANINTQGLLDAISVIESACARTWDGTEWSEEKTPTSNLAAWVLELMTSPHPRPSQYSDDELDLATFGAWYNYCEQMGFNADGVIIRSTKKKQVIETLCKNGNAALVYNSMTGKVEVAIDNGREYSVALLNSENIITISTSKDFKRKTTGKKVTYINAAADYDTDSVTFMRDGGEYDPATDTLTESALEYVTNFEHAYKIAWRQMAEENAQSRIVTVKTGLESAYYPLFSRVELQHKTLKIGIANGVIKAVVWQNNFLKEIHLDGAVTFPENTDCGLLINCVSDNGRGLLPIKVSGTGKTNILTVASTISKTAEIIPTAGNICSFGELDENGEFTTITRSMKITNTEESENGYTLTLVDYNPDLYTYGTLPEYRSNLTTVPTSNTQTVEDQRDYATEADAEANATGAAQAAVDIVTKGTRFTNVYKIEPAEMSLEDILAKIDDDARNTSASISISADEILLQVDDMARGLTGLIDVQAGAVTALVEGGGSAGQMSLTLNLPVMITPETRAKMVAASTEEKVAAVYAIVENTNYYGIKPNASESAIKLLWEDAVAGKLLASQIELQADQIFINGDVIVNEENKIKAAYLEVEELTAGFIKTEEVTSGSGTFTGLKADSAIFTNANITGGLQASYFSLSGFDVGDNPAIEIFVGEKSLWAGGSKWKSVGTGKFRAYLEMQSFAYTTNVADYTIKLNGATIWTESHTEDGVKYTNVIEFNINFGDELRLETTAVGGRTRGYNFSVKLCTNGNNEFFSLFPPVKYDGL